MNAADRFENAPVALLARRHDGRIVRTNAALADWVGRAQTDFPDMSFQDLLTVGTRIFFETHAAPLLRMQGHFSEIALELRTAGGGALPVFAHAATRPAGDTREPVVTIALSKALERRRYEREIVEARAQAKAA